MQLESSARVLQWLAVLEGDRCAFTRCEEFLSKSPCNTDEGIYRSEDGILRLYLRDKRECFNLSDRPEKYISDSIRFAQPTPNRDCVDPREAVSILASEGQTSSPVTCQFASKLARALGIPYAESFDKTAWHERLDSDLFHASRHSYGDLVRFHGRCYVLAEHMYANSWRETLSFVDETEDLIARMYGFKPSYNDGRTLRNLLAEISDWVRSILTVEEGTCRDACLRYNCTFFAKEIDTGFARRCFAHSPFPSNHPVLPRGVF